MQLPGCATHPTHVTVPIHHLNGPSRLAALLLTGTDPLGTVDDDDDDDGVTDPPDSSAGNVMVDPVSVGSAVGEPPVDVTSSP